MESNGFEIEVELLAKALKNLINMMKFQLNIQQEAIKMEKNKIQ